MQQQQTEEEDTLLSIERKGTGILSYVGQKKQHRHCCWSREEEELLASLEARCHGQWCVGKLIAMQLGMKMARQVSKKWRMLGPMPSRAASYTTESKAAPPKWCGNFTWPLEEAEAAPALLEEAKPTLAPPEEEQPVTEVENPGSRSAPEDQGAPEEECTHMAEKGSGSTSQGEGCSGNLARPAQISSSDRYGPLGKVQPYHYSSSGFMPDSNENILFLWEMAKQGMKKGRGNLENESVNKILNKQWKGLYTEEKRWFGDRLSSKKETLNWQQGIAHARNASFWSQRCGKKDEKLVAIVQWVAGRIWSIWVFFIFLWFRFTGTFQLLCVISLCLNRLEKQGFCFLCIIGMVQSHQKLLVSDSFITSIHFMHKEYHNQFI